ncbi:hypothetical protein [Alicyclobacillus sp. SO9]|uniref:hypothetical protein n=1 Tax=Alicyclobacillus sp. SO9 TaxID=2665646 RepID=UPI0018E806C2|nr:hypothetical protein [Alicyclobacillus sp. SO9]QQE80880.1 hypothetical protein GI364_11145 [Alicyclobacillus sp. SO9]
MADKLDLILQKLESLDELKSVLEAVRESQEISNARLGHLESYIHEIKSAVRFVNRRVADVELDVETMRKNH